jgi:hypothetical protein
MLKRKSSSNSLGQGVELTRTKSRSSLDSNESQTSTMSKMSSISLSAIGVRSTSIINNIQSFFSFKKKTKSEIVSTPVPKDGAAWRDTSSLWSSPEMLQSNQDFLNYLNERLGQNDDGMALYWDIDTSKQLDPVFRAVHEFLQAEAQFHQDLPKVAQFLETLGKEGCRAANLAAKCLGLIYMTTNAHQSDPMIAKVCNLMLNQWPYLVDWANGCKAWESDIEAFLQSKGTSSDMWIFHTPTRHFRMYRYSAWQLMQVGMGKVNNPALNEMVRTACYMYPKQTAKKTVDLEDPHSALQELEQSIRANQVKLDSSPAEVGTEKTKVLLF